ncbi:unnamed protein product [Sphagnum troendelagicum]|uniref:EF-hand domain-containing protein n=1 Tax=Sphagnum troendelagicum TaxID=128251 RepID=A0ABP0UIR6_9BRYO
MMSPDRIDDVATGTIFVRCVLALILSADLMMWRSTTCFERKYLYHYIVEDWRIRWKEFLKESARVARMKFPSFLKMKRTRSLQTPASLSAPDCSSSSSSSSSELSPRPGGRSGKELFLERKAMSLPSKAASSSSSSTSSWMWRESSARSASSGEQFLDQKLRHHVGMTTSSRELSSYSVQSRTFDASSELAEAFRYFDRNGVGKISAVELGLVLCSLGITYTDAELEMMVNEVDADGDGFIDLQEFINLNRLASKATLGSDSENNSDVEPALRDAFHVFDVEKKGYISADALHRVLSGLGDDDGLTLEDCRRMINSVDQDGDGLVDFNDFQLMMQHDNLVC